MLETGILPTVPRKAGELQHDYLLRALHADPRKESLALHWCNKNDLLSEMDYDTLTHDLEEDEEYLNDLPEAYAAVYGWRAYQSRFIDIAPLWEACGSEQRQALTWLIRALESATRNSLTVSSNSQYHECLEYREMQDQCSSWEELQGVLGKNLKIPPETVTEAHLEGTEFEGETKAGLEGIATLKNILNTRVERPDFGALPPGPLSDRLQEAAALHDRLFALDLAFGDLNITLSAPGFVWGKHPAFVLDPEPSGVFQNSFDQQHQDRENVGEYMHPTVLIRVENFGAIARGLTLLDEQRQHIERLMAVLEAPCS